MTVLSLFLFFDKLLTSYFSLIFFIGYYFKYRLNGMVNMVIFFLGSIVDLQY